MRMEEAISNETNGVQKAIGSTDTSLGESGVFRVRWGQQTNHSELYLLHIHNSHLNHNYTVPRSYSEYLWLHQALTASLPGRILPYFPTPATLERIAQKVLPELSSSIASALALKTDDLEKYIEEVSRDKQVWGCSAWVVFMIEDPNQFRVGQGRVKEQLGWEWQGSKSDSWVKRWFRSNKSLPEAQEESQEWKIVTQRVEDHGKALGQLLARMIEWTELKQQESRWKGKETELDSVEILRAKVASSSSAASKLAQSLFSQIVLPLLASACHYCQVRAMLQERSQKKGRLAEVGLDKGSKLKQWLDKFDTTFVREWVIYEERWKRRVAGLDQCFRGAWGEYCGVVGRIFK